MRSEPLLTIGAVFTSIKLAVTAVIGVIVIGAGLPDDLGQQVILAAGLVVVAFGDAITYFLTRSRVTSVASPNLPIGATVNANTAAPNGVVVAQDAP